MVRGGDEVVMRIWSGEEMTMWSAEALRRSGGDEAVRR